MELQLQHLCKQYGTKIAVDNVNICLEPGVYGLLGANGAGKTTIMRMICGVLRPTSGTIRLDGKTMQELGERYYTHLGYMPQDFRFYPDFTAREFMLYMAAVKGMDKKQSKVRTEELLELVNLRDVANKKVKSYSGGMKQRLGIAQAELNDPDILILDEPTAGRQHDELSAYPDAFQHSWLAAELHKDRNFKNWFKKGLTTGTLMNGLDQMVFRGHAPWTLHRAEPDHVQLKPAAECQPIAYPKPDGQLTFDRLSSVFISNTSHEENQPAHLTLKDPTVPVNINLAKFAGPEARYCPAGVYEFVPDEAKGGSAQRLQINAANCVHCKTCDIKDPTQNIVWVTPEGGGGPNYSGM